MAYPTGHSPRAGLSDTPVRADGDRPVEARSFSPVGAKSLTFPLVTDARRELTVTLAAKPVFDLVRRTHVGARVARTVRRAGGESALAGMHRVRLEVADLKRIEVETLRHGVGLLDLPGGATGVAPAFWRTVASSAGRFSLLYTGLAADVDAGLLLVEIMGVDMRATAEDVRTAIDHLGAQRRGVIVHAPPEPGMIARLAPVQPRRGGDRKRRGLACGRRADCAGEGGGPGRIAGQSAAFAGGGRRRRRRHPRRVLRHGPYDRLRRPATLDLKGVTP